MKSAYILRGLPGCGKSTLAKEIANNLDAIVSADYYFMKGGKYVFEPRNLGAAHSACRKAFTEALVKGIHPVVVDNTNIKLADFLWYEQEAIGHGYIAFIVEVHSGDPDEELARRNSHGVPLATITKMRKNFEHRPL